MRSTIQAILCVIVLCVTTSSIASNAQEKAITTAENIKFMLTSKNKSIALIQDGIDKINENCCEDNFHNKIKVMEIKNNLEKCLSDKCYDKHFVLFISPPLKAIVLRQLGEIENLILENEKVKFENISIVKKAKDEKNLQKSKNEKNIEILKFSLKEMNDDNIKLKKTVDKMLSKYQKRITVLEKNNNELTDKFNKAYEMLSKNKRKKLDKILSEKIE